MMYDRFATYLETLAATDMLRTIPVVRPDGAYIHLGEERLLNLSSNDYLGIATRGDWRDAALADVRELGALGSTSSRLMTGNSVEVDELEQLLARRFGRESALVLGSGYHMNVGILPALADSHTVILADKLVHASIIDGLRLCSCRFERFRHNDLNHLEKLLGKYADHPEIIIVVESIYSMDGDEADLRGLVALKQRYPQIRLYVDEAHAIGVRGAGGLGLAEETGTIADIDFLLGTFGKALASMGGYIICDDLVRRYLVNRCRSLIFSTALPPISIRQTLRIVEALPSYHAERERLATYTQVAHQRLQNLGLSTPSTSHIIPIILGEAERAVRLAEQMRRLGYYVLPIRPPTVPAGSCRLRLSLTSETDPRDFLDTLAPLLAELS